MPITVRLIAALVTLSSCLPPGPASADDVEDDLVASDTPEVIVASIDPDPPHPGAEMRLARLEFTRDASEPLKGYLAMVLTGDPAAVEEIIRGFAKPESCGAAALSTAFLPSQLVPRPLWLALRLECSSTYGIQTALALELTHLVDAARRDGELAPFRTLEEQSADSETTEGRDEPVDSSRCAAVETTLRSRQAQTDETPLPTLLAQLAQQNWRLPTTEDELCNDDVLAAAIRLHQGDATVRLAFDLQIDAPGTLPDHLVDFVSRFSLGGATPRLNSRREEAAGLICAALIEGGQLNANISFLTNSPERVPLCLHNAAVSLNERQDEAATAALRSISSAARHPGCATGAFTAALALVERGERVPLWPRDAMILGRALAGAIEEDPGLDLVVSQERLTTLRAAVHRLVPRHDHLPRGPVRLYQRDIRTVLDAASGARRSALLLLLESGSR